MKQLLLLFFFVLLASDANGQRQNIDSLVNVLDTKKQTGTYKEQKELYYQICDNYLYFDLDKMSEYASIALLLAEKNQDLSGQSLFTEYIGRAYGYKAEHDLALNYFNKALNLAQDAEDKEREACVYTSLGVTSRLQSKFEQSLDYLFSALRIHENRNDNVNILNTIGNIADIYISLNDYTHALEYLKKAEKIIETKDNLDSPVGILNVYYQLSSVYSHIDDPDNKSLAYAHKTFDLANKYGHTQFKIGALNTLAIHFANDLDYEKALEYGQEALELCKSFGHKPMIAGMLTSLSQIHKKMHNWETCAATADEAWQMDTTDVQNNKIALYNAIYSHIFLGNKEKAADLLDKYNSYWETSSAESLHSSLADMDIKYETEKKEMRIASLEKERQLYVWLGIVGIMLALSLGVALWLKIRNSRKEKQLIASNAVQEGEMGERERIAGELHDRLLGSLSAVKSEIDNTDLANKLNGCIEEIRRISRNLMPLPLRNGMKTALEDFTAPFPNVRFHFFGQERRVEKRLEFVVYCCANELVTNSIRHSGATTINVQLVQGNNHIALTVQDNGCGFDEKTVTKGVGLKSVQDRVASCNGKMNIFSSPNKGTETVIELNI